jgi:hypothetical protein
MNALLANDPALPQRDVLVDEDVMAQYLSRLIARYGDFDISHCERLRTKYRVGASLRVLYEVSGGGQSYRIAARAFPRSQQVTNTRTSTPEIYAPELNTIFWVFPHDRKIKNLIVLSGIPEELRDIEGREWVESRIVGHVPEKSVTVRCLDHDNQIIAYAKIYVKFTTHTRRSIRHSKPMWSNYEFREHSRITTSIICFYSSPCPASLCLHCGRQTANMPMAVSVKP